MVNEFEKLSRSKSKFTRLLYENVCIRDDFTKSSICIENEDGFYLY